jgi:hypothetical protein
MIQEGRLTDKSEIPRTHTIQLMDPPPPSGRSTVAMLQGDIDSGRPVGVELDVHTTLAASRVIEVGSQDEVVSPGRARPSATMLR